MSLLAQSGHIELHCTCLLLGVKRTLHTKPLMHASHLLISPVMLWRNSRGRPKNAPAAFIASVAVLTIVAFIILIAHKAHAQADVRGALTDHSRPGLGRPNSLQLSKPLIDPSGNIVHRNIEIVDTPTLIPGPRIDASLLLPASMKRRSSRWAWPTVSGPILINIDVMQVFMPWEFRVVGAHER